MNNKEEFREADRFAVKVLPIPINQFGYLSIFPDGFCIGTRISRDRKEIYIILRFYAIENKIRIPIGTYVLPIGMAKKLMEAIKDSIEKAEKEILEENEK